MILVRTSTHRKTKTLTNAVSRTFFHVTVARTLEQTYGRPRLMDVMCNPVAMMRECQRAAARLTPREDVSRLWSTVLLDRIP